MLNPWHVEEWILCMQAVLGCQAAQRSGCSLWLCAKQGSSLALRSAGVAGLRSIQLNSLTLQS